MQLHFRKYFAVELFDWIQQGYDGKANTEVLKRSKK
jgi:hypothetical protein